ncbi:hypothetical protein ACNQKP_05730 [Bdellovibrio bacteriovorus]|uniref:hypothetical protein n=1 Tax=Bdellovibrio bacteriovorus TaxID=959 RepID=UPI003AA87D3A
MKKISSQILVVVVVVAVAVVSFSLGRSSAPTSTASAVIADQIKSELISLTQKDFEEYQNLKTLEEKYKKADEILGKIVTVFLADLGVKLAFKSTSPTMLDGTCNIPAAQTQNPTAMTSNPAPAEANPTAPTPAPAKPVNEWINHEKTLLEVRDETLALEELKKMEIKDLFSTLKSSSALSTKNSNGIQGFYAGEITFFDRKTHKTDWLITWDVRLRKPNKEDAYALVILAKKDNGEVISRSQTSSGPLQDYMTVPGSAGLIVNIRADKAYIQIYPLNGNTQIWVGNVYEQKNRGEYTMTGQVRLNKQ